MLFAFPLIVFSLGFSGCQHTPRPTTGRLSLSELYAEGGGYISLAEIYRRTGVSFGYAPGPSSLELFACSVEELEHLNKAELTISRIKRDTVIAKNPQTVAPTLAGAIMQRLTDFGSYMDCSACKFDPAIRLTARTPKGVYEFDVCFTCKDIHFKLPSGEVRSPHMNRKLLETLIELTYKYYPNDPELRRLYH